MKAGSVVSDVAVPRSVGEGGEALEARYGEFVRGLQRLLDVLARPEV